MRFSFWLSLSQNERPLSKLPFSHEKVSSSKNHLFPARNLIDWGSWTSWTVMLSCDQQLSSSHMWALGRLCWPCPQTLLLSWGSLPKELQCEPGEQKAPSGFGRGVRQCQVAMWPHSTWEEVQARRRVWHGKGHGPKTWSAHPWKAGRDVPDVPQVVSTNLLAEGHPGLKAQGAADQSFSQACMSEMPGPVPTLLGLTLSAMGQSGVKDESVVLPLLPLSPACLHLPGQQGCLLPTMPCGTCARARAGSEALRQTLPLPHSEKAVPAQPPASCAHRKGQQSSVGASCDVLLWGAVFGGLKGYSDDENRTP